MYDNKQYINKNVKIICRLRGPLKSKTSTKKSKKIIAKSPASKVVKTTKNTKTKNSKSKSPSIQPQIINRNIDESTKYTIFTTKNPSNTLIISNKPIKGSSINQTFITANDLYDFNRTILKQTSLLQFDRVYNETTPLNKIYIDYVKENVSLLFHGKNSLNIFFGPIDGGKSFLLRGSPDQKLNEPGLLSRAINDVITLVDVNKQSNLNSHINEFFVIKLSIYQIYLDNVYDLLTSEIKPLKVEKYIDNNNKVNTNIFGLSRMTIREKSDYDLYIRDAMNQRKNLSQVLKVNELKRKSHLIISISLEKEGQTNEGINTINPGDAIFSQIDFVELASSNFGLMDNLEENDVSLNAVLYRNTSKTFSALTNNIVMYSQNLEPTNESKLTDCLKRTIKSNSNIVFFTCLVPYEYPINHSFKACKFANWLRNQVNNLGENVVVNPNNFNDNNNYNNGEEEYDENNNFNNNNINDNNNINNMNNNNINENNFDDNNNNNIHNNTYSNSRYNSDENNKINNLKSINIPNISNKLTNFNTLNTNLDNNVTNQPGNIENSHFRNKPLNRMYSNNVYPNSINSSIENPNLNNTFNTVPNFPNINNIPFSPIRKNNFNPNNNQNQIGNNNQSINFNNELLNNKLNPCYNLNNNNMNSSRFNPVNECNSENEENELRLIRERARKKYQSFDFNDGNPLNKQTRNQNKSSLNLKTPNLYSINNSPKLNNEQKIQNLENSLRQLEEKSFQMTQKLDNMRKNNPNYSNNNINNTTISYLPNEEIEKIKQDHATLKSDNIIFREDINRLTELNSHLEEELNCQRTRNLELANENEQLLQEKLLIEKKLKDACDLLEKNKVNQQTLEDTYNIRINLEKKVKEMENDSKKIRDEKSQYEIDYKVLKERFEDLLKKFDCTCLELNQTKICHNEEINKIEEKIDFLTKEIDKLQKENSNLRLNDEKQRMELNAIEKQRDNYRDKFQEQKNKNDLLSNKLNEIENDFKNLIKEKENENYIKLKEAENKKNKIESKAKIISDLQNQISNYRTQRLKRKVEDEKNN
jgi:hypothetical protein